MSEASEQMALFDWAKWTGARLPGLDLLFHIPNGEKRDKATAGRLRAMGVKPGVPDVFLPIPRDGEHGLFIELKDGKNKATAFQALWLSALQAQGYRCQVCYGWQAAARAIVNYLGGDPAVCGLAE